MTPNRISPHAQSRGRPSRGLVAAMALAACSTACQTYTARPLAPADARASFVAREATSAQLEAFAHSIEGGKVSPGTTAFDPSDGISLAEAEAIAQVFHPSVRVARMSAAVALAGSEHAGLLDDPTVGVDLTRLLEGGGDAWEALAGFSISLPLSDRLALERALADGQSAVEAARVVEAAWSARCEVRRAWAECAAITAERAALEAFALRLDEVLTLIDMLEARGEMSRVEARLFRIERATARAELARLVSDESRAGRSLRRAMGLPPEAVLAIAPSLGDVMAGGHAQAIATASTVAGLAAPAVLVAEAQLAAAERALALEVERQYPDLEIGPGYGRQDGDRQFVLGLGVRLPILNANRRAIAEAGAMRDRARVELAAAVELSVNDAADARAECEARATQRAAIESDIVPLVEAQDADVRRLVTLGAEVDALVLLDDLKRQHEARKAMVAARRAEALAEVRLAAVLGPGAAPHEQPSAIPAGADGGRP